jgi:hypothetical protein
VSVGAAQVWFVGRGGRWSGELMKRGVTNYRWQVGPGRVGWPLAKASQARVSKFARGKRVLAWWALEAGAVGRTEEAAGAGGVLLCGPLTSRPFLRAQVWPSSAPVSKKKKKKKKKQSNTLTPATAFAVHLSVARCAGPAISGRPGGGTCKPVDGFCTKQWPGGRKNVQPIVRGHDALLHQSILFVCPFFFPFVYPLLCY